MKKQLNEILHVTKDKENVYLKKIEALQKKTDFLNFDLQELKNAKISLEKTIKTLSNKNDLNSEKKKENNNARVITLKTQDSLQYDKRLRTSYSLKSLVSINLKGSNHNKVAKFPQFEEINFLNSQLLNHTDEISKLKNKLKERESKLEETSNHVRALSKENEDFKKTIIESSKFISNYSNFKKGSQIPDRNSPIKANNNHDPIKYRSLNVHDLIHSLEILYKDILQILFCENKDKNKDSQKCINIEEKLNKLISNLKELSEEIKPKSFKLSEQDNLRHKSAIDTCIMTSRESKNPISINNVASTSKAKNKYVIPRLSNNNRQEKK